MLRTSDHNPLRDLPAPEGAIRPETREQTPVHSLYQGGAMGYRETYYAYHRGREVQQYHQRLFKSNAQIWSVTSP